VISPENSKKSEGFFIRLKCRETVEEKKMEKIEEREREGEREGLKTAKSVELCYVCNLLFCSVLFLNLI